MPRSLPRFCDFRLARGEALVIGEAQRRVEPALVFAVVVDDADAVLIRKGVRRDEVLAPQLDGIEAALLGREIDQPLDDVDRLGPAGAAIGRGRHRVGHHRRAAEMHRRNVVDPRHDAEAFAQRREMRAIGADIGEVRAADGEELAARVERQLDRRRQVAAFVIGQKALAAVGQKFHRPAELLRRPGQQRIFGEEGIARAEIAAHVAAHRAALLHRHAERAGQGLALAHHAAAGAGPDRVAVLLVDEAQRRARLHRRAGDAVDPGLEFDDMLGRGESGVGLRLVADFGIDRDIVAAVVPHRGRARLHRIGGAHDRRQHLVIDLDQLGGVMRLVERLGDHHRHRLADILHRLVGHRQVTRVIDLVIGLQRQIDIGRADIGGGMRDRLAPVGDPIGAGIDRDHARRLLCRARIDPLDSRMGVRAPDHRRKDHVRHHDVGRVTPAAAQQPQILLPRQRLPDALAGRFLAHFLQNSQIREAARNSAAPLKYINDGRREQGSGGSQTRARGFALCNGSGAAGGAVSGFHFWRISKSARTLPSL